MTHVQLIKQQSIPGKSRRDNHCWERINPQSSTRIYLRVWPIMRWPEKNQ